MRALPYAEDLNYWQTSRESSDHWIEKTTRLIENLGGKVLSHAYGSDMTSGQAAFIIIFLIENERFKIVWPVLPSRTHRSSAAKTQAATFIFYDVKAKCLSAHILGAKNAFFNYWQLPDGRSVTQATTQELSTGVYSMALGSGDPDAIPGEVREV